MAPMRCSISRRRVEKARSNALGTPSSSAMPRRTWPEADTEGSGETGPEGGLVEEAGGPGVVVEEAGVGGGPGAVVALGHVGHQHVGVELGVARPRGPVREGGRHDPLGSDLAFAARTPADHEGVALEVAEGLGRPRPRARRAPSPRWPDPRARRGGRPTWGPTR